MDMVGRKLIAKCPKLGLEVDYPKRVTSNQSVSIRITVKNPWDLLTPDVWVGIDGIKGQVVHLGPNASSTVTITGIKLDKTTTLRAVARYYGEYADLCRQVGGYTETTKDFTIEVVKVRPPCIKYSYQITKKKLKPGETFKVVVNLQSEEDTTARVTVTVLGLKQQSKTVNLTAGKKTSVEFVFNAPTLAGRKDVKIKIEALPVVEVL